MGNSRFGALPARWEFHRGDRKQTASMHLLVRVCRISHLYLCIRGPRGFLWKIERGILPLFRGWGRYLLLAPSPFPSSFYPDRLLLSFVRSIHLSSCRSGDVASTSPSSNGVLEKISEGGVTLAKFSYFLASRKILFLWQQVEVVKGTIFFGKFVLVCLANRFRRCR